MDMEDVPEIIPLESYDAQVAKLRVSLEWLLAKAYNGKVPSDLQEPVVGSREGKVDVNSDVINMMVSGELYCLACMNILKHQKAQWQGHKSVLQALSRKGIYVVMDNGAVVTDHDLSDLAGFKAGAHLAMIESLMNAYIKEVVTIDAVVTAIRKFSSFGSSNELPNNLENGLLFWINKVCAAFQYKIDREYKTMAQVQGKKIANRDIPHIPFLEEILNDISDGCCIAVLVSFYCPDHLCFQDIALRKPVGIADSVHNFHLVNNFCKWNIPSVAYHFEHEDLLYTPVGLKTAILALVAELFYWFEVNPIDCVRSTIREKENVAIEENNANGVINSGTRINKPAISSATKKSFQKEPLHQLSGSNPELQKVAGSPRSVQRQPLLHKRSQNPSTSLRGSKPSSLNSAEDRTVVQQSVLAWQDQSDTNEPEIVKALQKQLEADIRFATKELDLMTESQDTQASNLLDNVSIDSDLEESFGKDKSLHISDLDKKAADHSSDNLRLESVGSSARSSRQAHCDELVNPVKDTNVNMETNHYVTDRRPVLSDEDDELSDSSASSNADDFVTPTESTDIPDGGLANYFDSFTENGSPNKSKPAAHSFTVLDHEYTVDSARAAGVPVIGTKDQVSRGGDSTETASTVSSSDAERVASRERLDSDELFTTARYDNNVMLLSAGADAHRPDSLFVESNQQNVSNETHQGSPTTSFAEIKKLRESFGLNQSDVPKEGSSLSLKEKYQKNKKVVKNAPKNQTTWRQTAQRNHTGSNKSPRNDTNMQPLAGELSNIRIKLEQRRRAMEKEKKKLESQMNKQRQRIGKQAFFHVVSKGKPSGDGQTADSNANSIDIVKPPLKTYSKAEIQETLNSVKQRWLSNEDSISEVSGGSRENLPNADVRSMSTVDVRYLSPAEKSEMRSKSMKDIYRPEAEPEKVDSSSSQESTPHAVSEENLQVPMDVDEYNSSLSKLNSSLTELQAEIMRLSLQQEQIKMAVAESSVTSVSPRSSEVTSPRRLSRRSSESSDSGNQQLQLDTELTQQRLSQHNAAQKKQETLRAQVPKSTKEVHESQQGGVQIHDPLAYQELYQNSSRSSSRNEKPTMPQYDQQHHQLIHGSPLMNAQSMPSLFTSPDIHGHTVPPQYQPHMGISPVGQLQPGYSQPALVHQQHLQQQQQNMPYGHMYPPYQAQYMPHHPSHGGAYPHPMQYPNTHNIYSPSQQPMYHGMSQHMIPTPHPTTHGLMTQQYGAPDVMTSSQQPVSSFQPSPQMQSTYTVGNTPQGAPPADVRIQAQQHQQRQDYIGDDSRNDSHQLGTYQEDEEPCDNSTNDVTSQQDTHNRDEVYPESSHGNTVEESNEVSSNGFFVSFDDTPKNKKPRKKTEKHVTPPIVNAHDEQPVPNKSPAVGFVIGHEAVKVDDPFEMQKKQERLKLLQKKRKDEQEKRRQQAEAQSVKKREEQRMKIMIAEQKKAEDKVRKELIFQNYKEKKEDEICYNRRPVKQKPTRKLKTKTTAPKGSQDDICTQPASPAFSVGSGSGSSNGRVDQTDSGKSLSFGGLTHRRSTSPPPNLSQQTARKAPSGSILSSAGSNNINKESEDYGGPKLFVKPTSKSNKNLIINAVSHCCLAGIVNTEVKKKVLDEINMSDSKHYLILFRDAGLQYRGLYTYSPERELVLKISGTGPKQVTNNMIDRYYKYNSGSKSFSQIVSTKHLSVSIDAFTIQAELWKTKKPTAAKR